MLSRCRGARRCGQISQQSLLSDAHTEQMEEFVIRSKKSNCNQTNHMYDWRVALLQSSKLLWSDFILMQTKCAPPPFAHT